MKLFEIIKTSFAESFGFVAGTLTIYFILFVISAIFIFSGIKVVTSAKKDESKKRIGYFLIGIGILFIFPLIIQSLISGVGFAAGISIFDGISGMVE